MASMDEIIVELTRINLAPDEKLFIVFKDQRTKDELHEMSTALSEALAGTSLERQVLMICGNVELIAVNKEVALQWCRDCGMAKMDNTATNCRFCGQDFAKQEAFG